MSAPILGSRASLLAALRNAGESPDADRTEMIGPGESSLRPLDVEGFIPDIAQGMWNHRARRMLQRGRALRVKSVLVRGRGRPNVRVVWLLLRSTHPGPTLVVSAATCGLGVAASLDARALAILVATVLFGQVSVGLSNDAIDAPRDLAADRADKPLARNFGLLRVVWILAIVFGVLSIVLSLLLGWGFSTAHLVFLLSGWLYNALLKATPLSVLAYMIGFGTLPSLPVLVASGTLAPIWATCAGVSLGVAIHCANVLPDIADDRRAGVLGFPQRLGQRAAAVVAGASLIAGACIVAVASGLAGDSIALAWVLFAAVLSLAAVACVLTLRGRATRTVFRIVMLAAGLLVVQLVLTGGFTA